MVAQLEKSRIVVADDNPIDHTLITRALRETGFEGEVLLAENGNKLIRLLKGQDPSKPGEYNPSMILLDLNMPLVDGREALKTIKNDPELKGIPVVVLTGSTVTRDVEDSYKNGADHVYPKPSHFQGLLDLMQLVKSYWVKDAG